MENKTAINESVSAQLPSDEMSDEMSDSARRPRYSRDLPPEWICAVCGWTEACDSRHHPAFANTHKFIPLVLPERV